MEASGQWLSGRTSALCPLGLGRGKGRRRAWEASRWRAVVRRPRARMLGLSVAAMEASGEERMGARAPWPPGRATRLCLLCLLGLGGGMSMERKCTARGLWKDARRPRGEMMGLAVTREVIVGAVVAEMMELMGLGRGVSVERKCTPRDARRPRGGMMGQAATRGVIVGEVVAVMVELGGVWGESEGRLLRLGAEERLRAQAAALRGLCWSRRRLEVEAKE